jgi:hypothetical protein
LGHGLSGKIAGGMGMVGMVSLVHECLMLDCSLSFAVDARQQDGDGK